MKAAFPASRSGGGKFSRGFQPLVSTHILTRS